MAYGVLVQLLGQRGMSSQAIGVLHGLVMGANDRPAAPPLSPTLPPQPALDVELRDQRLSVISWYSFGLGLCGGAWAIVWVIAHDRSAFDPTAASGMQFAATLFPAAVLSFAGWLALYWCWFGRLRHATYTNAAALALTATINLACIRNAEGAAVMTFATAAGLIALVAEGREWLTWGGILGVGALTGSVLHGAPLMPLVELPGPLATASLLCAAALGTMVPLALFWLFARNLTASREEAWELARRAAGATALATARARQLEERTEQLQAKNGELNDFLYVVSHDLRAPLINLAGFSGALRDGVTALDDAFREENLPRPSQWPELKRDIAESLEFIVRGVEKMDFLVQKLLELSRIDSRPNTAEAVELKPLLDQIVDSLRFMIAERRIAVRVDPLPVVRGDPVRISQVFANLLDNAVKYSKPHGDTSVHVGCELRDGTPRFFVRDTGVGIRPQDQSKIFRLFARIGGSGIPGDGMGLTAVKKILEKHGGRIWVESALGEGSTFWFTLPGGAEDEEVDDGTRATRDQNPLG